MHNIRLHDSNTVFRERSERKNILSSHFVLKGIFVIFYIYICSGLGYVMGHCVAMCYYAVGRVIVPLSPAYNFASAASEKFFGNILRQNSDNRYRYRNRYGTDISLKITRIHYPVDFERKPKKPK